MENGILQNACSTSPKMDADLVKSAPMRIARLMNSRNKRSEKNGDKSAVAMLKITRQLGCVFQDMEPPKSSSILRNSSNIRETNPMCSDSLKPCYVMPTFETKIHRLEWFAQVILISVTPMIQNLRIGFKKRRNGKSDVPMKQRGSWPTNIPK